MNKRKIHLVLSVFVLLGLLACSLPRAKTPTPAPATADVQVVATPTDKPTDVQPKATNTPTPTPLPPTAPLLLYRQPDRGAELSIDAPLVLTFDQAMDKSSVEKAFSIEPDVKGDFEWAADRVLMFKPVQPWAREAVYQVSVGATAKSANGMALREEVGFRFATTGFLSVTQVQPTDKTVEVAMDSRITVMFNRPVVPLVAVADMSKLPQPLTFDPPVEGTGEWLNTSIYVWTPTDGFAPSTTYSIIIKAGLQDTTGGVLAEDYTWSFTTQMPRVILASPADGYQYVSPSEIISVTFNQPMDVASVEAKFSLNQTGQAAVKGTFTWSDDRTSFQFAPASDLPRGQQWTAKIDQGALSAGGQFGIEKAYTWQFKTVEYPRVIKTVPANAAQEVNPYGSMNVYFSAPMDRETLPANLKIEFYDPNKGESGIITATQVYSYWGSVDTTLYLHFSIRASSFYTVTLGDGLADPYGVRVPESTVISFGTRKLDPMCYLSLPGSMGTFNAYLKTTVAVAYRNVSRIDFELYELSADELIPLIGYYDPYRAWSKLNLDDLLKVNEWSLDVQPPLNDAQLKRFAVLDAGGNSPAPGLYLLQVQAPEINYKIQTPSRYLLSISKTGVILKADRDSILAWVTDLQSGQPVEGANVLFRSESLTLGNDTTDASGLATATFGARDIWMPVFATVEREGDLALASTAWADGISTWEFGISTDYYPIAYNGEFYTDRPIYRPGQTVYFKGIVREDDDAQYTLPPAGSLVRITIEDSQGRKIYEKELPLSNIGTVNDELTLDAEASLGYYYLSASLPNAPKGEGYFGASFRVAEYKKPEYQVAVETDLSQYVHGDTINVTAHATYYFGGPVGDAEVRWAVLTQDYSFWWQGPGWYSWDERPWQSSWEQDNYYAGYGELIAEGKGRTDSNGRFTFSVPADIAARFNSQIFTLEVTVTDINNQEVSNRTQTVVHKGLFYVGLSPRRYVGKAGEEQSIDIKAISIENELVANQDITVVFLERKWYNTQKEGSDGRWYWDWELEEIPVYTTTVRTNAEGNAVARWTPDEGGSYKVRALAQDERSNQIRSAAYMWVSSRKWISWRRENNDRIELIADKREYNVGDVAEILIPSPFQGPVKALVTVERGDILDAWVIDLESNSDILRIPILEAHVPNIFISVVIVKGMDESNELSAFKLGYVALPVSTDTKVLNITITPDRNMNEDEYYRPRETVKYEVQVIDHSGKGVETELSLDLVDLSVLALTGGDRGRDLLDAFYYQRGVGIQTAASLVINVDRVVEELPIAEGKGGGGGAMDSEGLVRTNFVDTAYWNATLRTDANGKATVEVTLPDNLTTWRLRGRGVTAETLVGESTVDVMSTLDLLVRPVVPRFFVVGDKATLSVVVNNNTGEDLDATVKLEAVGLDMDGGPQSVVIPAKGKVKADWQVSVKNVTQITLRASVNAAPYSDAMEFTIPVYTYSTPEVVATAGQIETGGDERLEAVILPQVLDPTQGELTIQVDPSLAAGMQDGLKYLEHYPYECIEQVVSRWLPNVLTYKALHDLGIENPELEEKLPGLVSEGLQRIYARQNYDGGWGWWSMNASNPFLSAYVLLGLIKAEQADLIVDQTVQDNAIKYLRGQLKSPATLKMYQRNWQAFMLYVLAEAGEGDLSRTVRLYDDRDKLSNYAKAYLAMALGIVDQDGKSNRVRTLLDELIGDAVISASGAHWEEAWVDYWSMNTDTRTTAVVIDAFAKLDPDNALLPNAVRWLMVARKAGHWETTQETAWALISLTDYMRMTGELEADYSYMIALNGKAIDQQTVTRNNVDQSFKVTVPIVDLLKQEVNQVWVSRDQPAPGQTGEGRLYYAMYLRYFMPVEEVEALSRGIIVARQYFNSDCTDEVCEPITSAQVGDVIRVKLTLIAPNDLHFLVVEDPLPAGAEAVDRSLQTTSVVGQDPTLENVSRTYGRGYYGWGWWWFTHTDMRDEKVALFADYLPRGTYEYTYLIRASVPGEFLTIPTTAYLMYFPEVWGRSDGGKFIISE